jgi:hypothetical protein
MFTLRHIICSILLVSTQINAQETELAPRPQIHIRSEPAGAQIFINGQEAGYTPFLIDKLLVIGDKIQAFAHGYQPWTRPLTEPVLKDTVTIALTRHKARLAIHSDQLDALGAEIRLRFADWDTLITGFVNIGRGNVAFESDIYVGKYHLEITKRGFNPIEQDLFLPPRGKLIEINLTQSPLPLSALSVPNLVEIADQYRSDSAQLLAAALAIGETAPAVETSPAIRLFDPRITPFVEELERYSAHTREIERLVRRTAQKELGVLRALAQIDVYRGILLGKYRRFAEAHNLFREARERSPFPIEQEPNPLPNASLKPLGDYMRFVDTWHDDLGRLDVSVSPTWLATQNLKNTPLYFEQVLFTRESTSPPPTSPAQQAMHDSLVALAEQMLQDNIKNRQREFSLALPKGHYNLKDAHNLVVPVSFRVSAPTAVKISPRVTLWLPEAKTVRDTVQLQPILGNDLGPIVPADQVAFGQEYELLIKTGDYKRRLEKIIIYQSGGLKPVWPGITAIPATPGADCLYYKTGANKLQTSILSSIPGQRKDFLKYLLIPLVGIGIALAL